MKEFTGQLIGGPDDGNFVTASKSVVAVTSTVELALDGVNADISIVVTQGNYVWNPESKYFEWKLIGSQVYTKKLEAA